MYINQPTFFNLQKSCLYTMVLNNVSEQIHMYLTVYIPLPKSHRQRNVQYIISSDYLYLKIYIYRKCFLLKLKLLRYKCKKK